MRLRLLTGFFLAMLIGLVLVGPLVLRPIPSSTAPRLVRREYSVRVLEYLGVVVAFFTASAVGSLVILRREREAYRRESLNNIKELIEGSLKDANKGSDGRSQTS